MQQSYRTMGGALLLHIAGVMMWFSYLRHAKVKRRPYYDIESYNMIQYGTVYTVINSGDEVK